jgi:hypothetical protein
MIRPATVLVPSYIVVVVSLAAICATLAPDPPLRLYRATHNLRANHRLRDVDIAKPAGLPPTVDWRLPASTAVTGKYVRRDVVAGAVLTAELLSPVPDLSCYDCVITTFNAPLGAIPLGAKVDVCDIEGDCIGSVSRVLAVECADAATTCALSVGVPTALHGKAVERIRGGKAELRVLWN